MAAEPPLVCDNCGKELQLTRRQRVQWKFNRKYHGFKRTFCSAKCYHVKNRGEAHSQWRGGWFIDKNKGYRNIHSEGTTKMRTEHSLIVEKALGHRLPKGAVIHHVDGNKLNNAKSNLLVCSVRYHTQLHLRMSTLYAQEHFGGS